VAAMRRVCALIEKSEQPPTLEQLAEVAGLSASRFRRAFKELIGVTPHQYIKAHQRERLQKTLQHADSVTTAIYDAGFGAASRVYEKSDALLGMTPATFRRGGDALTIRYASTACDLGRVLVAATEKGLCAIFLGDDDEPLFAELEARFRAATLERDDSLGDVLAQVVSFVQAPERGLTLPLDIRGTAFQQRVWQTLQTIPVGETRGYRQVAEMLGSPGAVRAVASACAKNPLAVVVPCHRVIGSDGKLHGYHWGLERKQKLLDRESSE
jgi:AraC family transcriptional regulator of adaptative response/methylated-DNA-[protein]-cysteine methyltransferase